jgi:hypothetical protein
MDSNKQSDGTMAFQRANLDRLAQFLTQRRATSMSAIPTSPLVSIPPTPYEPIMHSYTVQSSSPTDAISLPSPVSTRTPPTFASIPSTSLPSMERGTSIPSEFVRKHLLELQAQYDMLLQQAHSLMKQNQSLMQQNLDLYSKLMAAIEKAQNCTCLV